MDQLIGYVATGVVSLLVGLLLQRYQAKPKLLYWIPGTFTFELKEPKLAIRTDSVTIQNDGRKPATNIEIVHKERPDHFQFSTAISYSEETTPSGEHIIKVPSLGPKEHVNIQLLGHTKIPVLLNVRSAEGPAQNIQVHLQRIFPKWVYVFVGALMLLGFGFGVYWLIRSVHFISVSIGLI